jgi:hypothetical protein
MAAIGTPYCLATPSKVSPGWTVYVATLSGSDGDSVGIEAGVAGTVTSGRMVPARMGVILGNSGRAAEVGGALARLAAQDATRSTRRSCTTLFNGGNLRPDGSTTRFTIIADSIRRSPGVNRAGCVSVELSA